MEHDCWIEDEQTGGWGGAEKLGGESRDQHAAEHYLFLGV